MIRKISLLSFIFCSLTVLAQKDFVEGFVILESNDTVFGGLENKEYYSKRKVKIYHEDNETWFSRKVLSGIHIDSVEYVKSDIGFGNQRFVKKELSGHVNLYILKRSKGLGGFDSDVTFGKLKSSIRFYCSDYPYLTDEVKKINNENIDSFIIKYNTWKSINPENKSFFERKIHHKPRFNFKTSFLLPGLGFEFGLSNTISVTSMVKSELGYMKYGGLILNPFVDTQIRYYYDIEKRKQENKRTYKYSGNYVCLFNGYYLFPDANLNGVLYGWQRIINKYHYYNFSLGAGKWTTGKQYFTIIFSFDFGFNF